MRRVLLEFLLIAVFLNSVIGVPLHAAVHLVGGAVQPASPDHGEDQDDRSHAPCAWCLAHTETSSAPPAALDAPLLGHRQVRHARPATAVAPAFDAGLWSSSPRGPPSS